MTYAHRIKGKALLVVDAGHDLSGRRTYTTEPFVQTGSGLTNEGIAAATEEFGMMDGHVFDVPGRCKKMKPGDRWRLSIAYEIRYTKRFDPILDVYEWDTEVFFRKVTTLRKQPWNTKRHERYISKADRAKLEAARAKQKQFSADLLSMLGQA